ncbi:OLC1v1002575C1 [Oldenlandia corymbosa var. corymbosa]|uniref:OLC1v1002575C1 n=1 Tax=Oldenlandia corymbosa var. corymbosa TaxID=529605 RepID=A0AAV1D7Y7_OLDCO|nr:OLC1v1002575C1 [Oldenlandia corymbosa var. corymbosa]
MNADNFYHDDLSGRLIQSFPHIDRNGFRSTVYYDPSHTTAPAASDGGYTDFSRSEEGGSILVRQQRKFPFKKTRRHSPQLQFPNSFHPVNPTDLSSDKEWMMPVKTAVSDSDLPTYYHATNHLRRSRKSKKHRRNSTKHTPSPHSTCCSLAHGG